MLEHQRTICNKMRNMKKEFGTFNSGIYLNEHVQPSACFFLFFKLLAYLEHSKITNDISTISKSNLSNSNRKQTFKWHMDLIILLCLTVFRFFLLLFAMTSRQHFDLIAKFFFLSTKFANYKKLKGEKLHVNML